MATIISIDSRRVIHPEPPRRGVGVTVAGLLAITLFFAGLGFLAVRDLSHHHASTAATSVVSTSHS
jgi:hypothetical protein